MAASLGSTGGFLSFIYERMLQPMLLWHRPRSKSTLLLYLFIGAFAFSTRFRIDVGRFRPVNGAFAMMRFRIIVVPFTITLY